MGQRIQNYVLLTAAYNEEAFIEKTLRSVLSQTVLPRKWVIVSDGSSDRTDQIVQCYSARHDFIKLLRVEKKEGHNFGAKVRALHKGMELLRDSEYDFIGNLDADVSLESTYFEDLMREMAANPELGIASGFVCENHGAGFQSRWFNSKANAPHAAQLVRRECYDLIGGYAILKYGGEDWHAQTCAKMHGWQVESFPQLKIYHHRNTGAGDHPLRNAFRLGRMDYSFGSDPIFEVVKSIRKFKDKPYVICGFTRLLGFFWCYLCGEKRPVSHEFLTFLRREQRARVSSLFSGQTLRPVADRK